MKKYIIIFVAIIFVTLGARLKITIRNNQKLKSEIARVNNNNLQLKAESIQIKTLILKEKEITKKLKGERDSIAKQLKIKPKQIEKIIYIDNIVHDTINKPILTTIVSKGVWYIKDSTECLKLRYKAVLDGDSLKTTRELLDNDDRITQAFYRERPHKFLFIRFGRWQYRQILNSKCGDPVMQSIQFVK